MTIANASWLSPFPVRAALIAGLLGWLGLPITAHAATYYVASNGKDSYTASQAQNIQTPWRTLQKAASVMVAGDICLIREGTYREPTIRPTNSGTAAAPIIFQAYDSTTEPVILDGTEYVTGWTRTGDFTWKAALTTSLGDGNQVFIDNVMQPEARWPNAGPGFPWQDSSLAHPAPYQALGDWSYVDAAGYTNGANGWFVDAQLPDRPDGYWTGASVHIMSGHGWIMQNPAVTASSDNKITTNDPYGPDTNGVSGAYTIGAGNEYYLTGIKGEMDRPGEWFYDATAGALSIYSTGSPTGVTAKQRNYCFNLASRSHIKLANLNFFACTVQTDAVTSNITYDGLVMKYLGHSRKHSSVFGLTLRNGDVLRNSELAWDSRGLVNIAGSDVRIINNHFHDSGYTPTWTAMLDAGINNPSAQIYQRNLISHNTLHDTGRAMIGFPGRASIVQYNNLYNGMRLTTDGGLFYNNLDGGNSVVRYNLMHDADGPAGHTGSPVMGLYLDAQNNNWIIHNNIIWNLPGYAIQINQRQNFNMVFNNSCWNTQLGSLLSSFAAEQETGTRVFNNLFNGYPVGTSWTLSDLRFNLYTDPLYFSPTSADFRLQSNSPAFDVGTPIPGVTDSYPGAAVGAAPDMGALEYGGTDWTTMAGHSSVPPSPDPVYSVPTMIFANQVKDGSFESATTSPMATPNWSVGGANPNVSVYSANSWSNYRIRTGGRSIQFGAGESEIRQTITGLLPNRRYKVYGAVQYEQASPVVKLGVRNHGFAAREITASPAAFSTEPNPIHSARSWTMYNQAFITGPNSTSAEIYLSAAIPAGAAPVYVDDFGVELSQDPGSDPIMPMPAFHLPFDETSGGTVAYDATTHGRNGTISGGATWSPGFTGNVLNFDGVNDYVTVPGPVPATSQGSFTVATRVKFNDIGTATTYPTLVSNNNDAWLQKGWQIKVAKVYPATDYQIGFYLWQDDATGPGTWIPQTVAPGQWVHVAFVIDRQSGTLTSYLNGVRSSSSTIPASFTNADTALGTRIGSASFNGQLDDVRIYDAALSAAQIATLKNADSSKLLHLELDETAGSAKAWDASGRGMNGVLTNMNTATAWMNGVLSFDGINDYVAAPIVAPSLGSFTVATRVKFNDIGTATTYPTLVSNNNDAWLQKGWQIKVAKVYPDTDYKIGFYLWQADATGPGNWIPQTVAPGQWVHVAFVIDRQNGTLTSYLNGVRSSSSTIPASFTNADTALGTRIGSASFSGQLDDVRIYSRVLSENEVLDLSARNSNLLDPPYP